MCICIYWMRHKNNNDNDKDNNNFGFKSSELDAIIKDIKS